MAGVVDEKVGKDMKEWMVRVFCLDPNRCREMPSVAALSEEQAVMIAEKRASEMFGRKGEGWIKVEVHMPNIT